MNRFFVEFVLLSSRSAWAQSDEAVQVAESSESSTADEHLGAALRRAALEDGVFVAGEFDRRYGRHILTVAPPASMDATQGLHQAIVEWNAVVPCGRLALDPAPYGYDARVLDGMVDGACVPRGAAYVHPIDQTIRIPELDEPGRLLELPRALLTLEQWMVDSGVPASVHFQLGAAIQVESGESTTLRALLARAESPGPGWTPVVRIQWLDHRVQVEYLALQQVYPERWPRPPRPVRDFGVPSSPRQVVTREQAAVAMKKLATGEPLERHEQWLVNGTPVTFEE